MKTTKTDFAYFKKYVKKWVDVFELNDWKVYFEQVEMDDFIGYCTADVCNRMVTITLGLDWNSEITKKSLDEVAFHEVVELLLAPYHNIAQERSFSPSSLEKVSHQIIRTLENVIFANGINRVR